jgi:hypothetical protein
VETTSCLKKYLRIGNPLFRLFKLILSYLFGSRRVVTYLCRGVYPTSFVFVFLRKYGSKGQMIIKTIPASVSFSKHYPFGQRESSPTRGESGCDRRYDGIV